MKEKKTTSINLRGIERATNDINVPDGAADEIINLRLKDGAWRPLGGKFEIDNFTPISGYETYYNIYHHSILGRTRYIAVNGQAIMLINNPEEISPIIKNIDAIQTETEFVITINTRGAYTITKNQSWITLSDDSGVGSGTVTVTVEESGIVDRVGTVTITSEIGSYVCTINQEGITLLATSPVNASKFAQDVVIDITSILPAGSTFSSAESPDVAWITGLVDDQGADTVTVSLLENATGIERTATVRVTHVEFPNIYVDISIIQSNIAVITCDPETLDWGASDYPDVKVAQINITPDAVLSFVTTGSGEFTIPVIDQGLNQITIGTKGINSGEPDYVMTVEIKATGYESFFLVCTQVGTIPP